MSKAPASLLPKSSQLQAVANAFVMLDIIAYDAAEAVLAEHRAALEGLGIELAGVKSGELTLRPTTAYGLAQARPPQAKADDVPLLVAAPGTLLTLPKADLIVGQLVIGPAGLRGHAVIEGHDAGKPRGWLLPELFVSDDVGRSYGLDVAATTHRNASSPRSVRTSRSCPMSPGSRSGRARRGGACRTGSARGSPLGDGGAPWPTPAECLLAWLTPELPPLEAEAQFGVGLDATEAMAVVASVADALLAVGVLPLDSSLLRQLPAVRASRWQFELARRFKPRALARLLGPVAEQDLVALGARLPLQMATAVLDWMVVDDDCTYFQLYVAPDAHGEYWPVTTPTWTVLVTDDLGREHDAVPARFWRGGAGAGWGDFVLWPPVSPLARRLRLQVSTLWEAAWVEVTLPR